MLGKRLAESGGTERIANTLIGLIVGLPAADPVAFKVASKTGQPLLMVAGWSAWSRRMAAR